MSRFIMLVGLPGSGKSYYAKQQYQKLESQGLKCHIHSSDAIREELSGNVNNQDINSLVFQVLHKRVKEDLSNNINVIYDATNINWKKRKAFIQTLNKINCYKECIVIATPIDICHSQNESRERKVPEEVIDRMYSQFDIPWYDEGWNAIEIAYPKQEYMTAYGYWQDFTDLYYYYDQDSKYHTLPLGQHCASTYNFIQRYYNKSNKWELLRAAALHDCGKPSARTYINTKGEKDEHSHYYGHENYGCYKCLFYNTELGTDKLLVSVLIRWHMMMHDFHRNFSDKARTKYYNKFNSDEKSVEDNVWELLKNLYLADSQAH